MTKDTSCCSDADPTAMSIEQVRSSIDAAVTAITESELIGIELARGRILAVDIHATMNLPPFRSSAMDGYAFRHAEASHPLKIVGKSLAGHPGDNLLPTRTCQSITTGARVPDDADTVVMHENTQLENGELCVKIVPALGFNVRQPGSDSPIGQCLLKSDQRLRAAELALLAAHGIEHVTVKRRLRLALFSTGDELKDAGEPLQTGQIYDANRPLLTSLLIDPAIDIIDLGIYRDNLPSLNAAFDDAANSDVVVSSGGVSVGDADFIRPLLEQRGRVHLWKVAMKPGRPLTFGFINKHQAYFGLPGNPVSAALTCLIFVNPALCNMLSQQQQNLPTVEAILTTALHKLPGRVEYQRGILTKDDTNGWSVSTTGLQDSHVLSSLQQANCLIELPLESAGHNAGDRVMTIPFAHFSEPML